MIHAGAQVWLVGANRSNLDRLVVQRELSIGYGENGAGNLRQPGFES